MKTTLDAQGSLLKKWSSRLLTLCLSTCVATAVQAGEKIEADPENGRYFSFEEVQGKGDWKGQVVGRAEFTDANGAVTYINEYAEGGMAHPEGRRFLHEESRVTNYMNAMPFDLDFKGGSLEELLLAIEKGYTRSLDQTPEALRAHTLVGKAVFKSDDDLNLRFPSISARGISLYDLRELLKALLPDIRCDIETRAWSDPGSDQITGTLFYVETEAKTDTGVFNMADVQLASDTQKHEAVVAVMEAAWQAGGKRAIAAKVSYHAPSNLLIVNGLPRELNDARQVVRALQTKESAKQTELEELKALILSLQAEISKLQKDK